MLQTKAVSVSPLNSSMVLKEEIIEEVETFFDDEIKIESTDNCGDVDAILPDDGNFLNGNLFDNELPPKTFEDDVFVNEVTIEEEVL